MASDGSVPDAPTQQSASASLDLYTAVGSSVGVCVAVASIIIVILILAVWRRRHQGAYYATGIEDMDHSYNDIIPHRFSPLQQEDQGDQAQQEAWHTLTCQYIKHRCI